MEVDNLFEQVKFLPEEIGAGEHVFKFHCFKVNFKNFIGHIEFKCKDIEQVKEIIDDWWEVNRLLTKLIGKVENK
jgi:hypothetical protein